MSRKHPGSRHHAALDKRRWARVRLEVFERDGYRCTSCGRPGRLEAHHSPALDERGPGADPYDVDTIVTLCRPCHIDHHRPAVSAERAAWKARLENSARL